MALEVKAAVFFVKNVNFIFLDAFNGSKNRTVTFLSSGLLIFSFQGMIIRVMLFKSKKKISEKEVENEIEKIRLRYNDYIISFMKSPKLKDEFELRYISALRQRMNMEMFIKQENESLDILFKSTKAPVVQSSGEKEEVREQSVERILNDLKEKIAGYPVLPGLHQNTMEEVARLYGTMFSFYNSEWPALYAYLKKRLAIEHCLELDTQLGRMIPGGREAVPRVLEKYQQLLRHPGAVNRDISREARGAINLPAVWLNEILENVRKNWKDADDSNEELLRILKYMDQIVQDFRLKNLKIK